MAAATQRRRGGLDLLKGICAFLIVCIHAPFPGAGGEYFTSLTRMAVPVFFMITGYFYNNVRSKGRVKDQLKKVFGLFLGGNLLYFAFGIATAAAGGTVGAYLSETFTAKKLLRLLLFNETVLSSHLWYLGALLYVLLIKAALDRFLPQYSDKILYVLTPVLLLGDLMFGKYSQAVFGRTFPYILVRNFLFVGIPYFTIGRFLYEKRDRLHISMPLNTALVFLFAVTTLLERYLLVRAGLNTARDHYLSTTFLAVAAFILFCSNEWDQSWARPLEKIGRDYSAFIYIIHPLMIKVAGKMIGMLNNDAVTGAYNAVRPIVIYLGAVLLAGIYYKIRKRISADPDR